MTAETVLFTAQILLALTGGFVLVRAWRAEASAPADPKRHPLAPWDLNGFEFAMACLRVILTVLVCQWLAYQALGQWAPESNATEGWGVLVLGAATQFGLIMGLLLSLWLIRRRPRGPWETPEAQGYPAPIPLRQVPLAGVKTYLATYFVVVVVSWLWSQGLHAFGVELNEQEMLTLVRSSQSPVEILCVGVLACLVAPVAEEGLFRAGLFRFVRTRVPLVLGYLIPAVVFALVHYSLAALPGLIALAIVFSLAYERTGRIAVTMVAHGLFNLTTLVQTLLAS